MANAAGKLFTSFLESKGMHPVVLDEEGAVVRVSWKLDNTQLSIYFSFNEECTNVHIMGKEFASVPADKTELMYKVCNDLNMEYRWTKFYVNEGEVIVEDDAVIQLDSCAEEDFELMIRMTQIVDDAYKKIMKAMWA